MISQNNAESEIEKLLSCAFEITRKFDTGRANDIRPGFVQNIITHSVNVRKTAKDQELISLLIEIEDVSYTTLVNIRAPDYYKYLRNLADLLQSLSEFK